MDVGSVAGEGLAGDGQSKLLSRAEQDVRAGFVRKVYSLLAVQLVVTTAIAAPLALMQKNEIMGHIWLMYLATFVSLAVMLGVTCCCQGVARKVPYNYIFLFTITICEGIIVGFITSGYTLPSVMLAAGLTCAIFVALTAYACFTKSDFTGLGPYLFVALIGLMFFGFIMMFFTRTKTMQKIYAGIGAIIFCFYIVMDTQKIVRGTHKYPFSVDDYVFAALNIYLDIINLFIQILQLVGDRR